MVFPPLGVLPMIFPIRYDSVTNPAFAFRTLS